MDLNQQKDSNCVGMTCWRITHEWFILAFRGLQAHSLMVCVIRQHALMRMIDGVKEVYHSKPILLKFLPQLSQKYSGKLDPVASQGLCSCPPPGKRIVLKHI